MQLAGRHREQRSQAAVAVDTERLVMLAAVGEAPLTGIALLAVDVGLDAAAVARLHVLDPRPHRHHLDAEFMARDARVAEERHLAEVAAVVGAADADGMHADDGRAGAGCRRLRGVDEPEGLGVFEEQGLHGWFPGGTVGLTG